MQKIHMLPTYVNNEYGTKEQDTPTLLSNTEVETGNLMVRIKSTIWSGRVDGVNT